VVPWAAGGAVLAVVAALFAALLRGAFARSPGQAEVLVTATLAPRDVSRFWPVGALVAAGGWTATAPVGGALVHRLLERVTVTEVGQTLAGVGTAMTAAALAVGWGATVAWVQGRVGRMRRVSGAEGLPAPERGSVTLLRLVSWSLGLPVLGWSLAVYFLTGEHLGEAAAAPPVLAMLSLGLLAWATLFRLPRAAARFLAPAAAVGVLGVLAWGAVAYPAGSDVEQQLSRSPLARIVLPLLRAATDFDRDGVGTLYGGKDCAAWDPAVRPGAPDVPGNGVDEDCDGRDAAARLEPLPLGGGPAVVGSFKGYNVVLIQLDSVRSDHVSGMGYPRQTTPSLDALAAESLVFDNAWAQSSGTRKSVPSVLAGRYPQHMQWDTVPFFYQVLDGNVMLPEILKEHGYQTYAVVSPWVQVRLAGLGQGVDAFVTAQPQPGKRVPDYDATVTATRSIELVEKRDPARPFFLYAYFEDPHAPYDKHPGPGLEFGDSDVDRYDSEIAFADRWAGFLIEYLKVKQLWENSVVIVFADHGSEFGEHGMEYHGRQLYVESLRVPVVVHVPGVAPRREHAGVALVDLFPTVLDAVGIVRGRETLEGYSLLRYASGAGTDVGEPRPIFSYVRREGSAADRKHSVVEGSWHYILSGESGREELYDVGQDPGERRDALAANPERAARLREILARFLEGASLK